MNNNLQALQLMQANARNASMSVAATNPTIRQFVGIIIEYVGASASCLITTAAGNSIASKIGALGAEAADPLFTIGAAPGTLDLTAAAGDTMGEVVDFINNLADYKARLVGLRRSDTSSTTAYLVAVTDQQAKVAGVGLSLAVSTADAKQVTCELSMLDGNMFSGGNVDKTIRHFGGLNGDYKRNSLVELHQVDETLTYTGTGTFEVIEVDDKAKTDEVIFTSTIPGASTAAGTKSFGSLGVSGITARIGRRLLVRFRGASTLSAITNLTVYGKLKCLN